MPVVFVKPRRVGTVPTANALAPVKDRRITATVPAISDSPRAAQLPKLSEQVEFRVDEDTKRRLEALLVMRAKTGLRLSLGDLGRESLLRYLDEEESKYTQAATAAA